MSACCGAPHVWALEAACLPAAAAWCVRCRGRRAQPASPRTSCAAACAASSQSLQRRLQWSAAPWPTFSLNVEGASAAEDAHALAGGLDAWEPAAAAGPTRVRCWLLDPNELSGASWAARAASAAVADAACGCTSAPTCAWW
jgi:hypothetical protein